MQELEMTVVEVEDLPEKFQPAKRRPDRTIRPPSPLSDLVEKATSGLTDAERWALLSRLREERPGLFSDEDGEEASREEWKELLVRFLKEEANRFMAAAAKL